MGIVHNTVGTNLTQAEFESASLHLYNEYVINNPVSASIVGTASDMGKFYFMGGASGDLTLPIASTITAGMAFTITAQNSDTAVHGSASDILYHYGTGGSAAQTASVLLTVYSIYKFTCFGDAVWVWWLES